MRLEYKNYTIETKETHFSGIHENYVAQVINSKGQIVARFGKAVPAVMDWKQNQLNSIEQAKRWIDKHHN